jgi:hypothetical protein
MACWVRPSRRHRRARCWRDSVAQKRTTRGSRTRARAQAAMQVMDRGGTGQCRAMGWVGGALGLPMGPR